MNRWGNGLILVLGLLTSICYAGFVGGYAAWFLCGSLSLLVLYAGGVKGMALRGLTVTSRVTPSWGFAGEEVTVELRLTRSFPFPWPG
ncbi:hypothetical protein N6H14_14345 [Paenibacillus sp. CC-CFT747]|nr:hypothetical protein N6H14_14345 [Paenibacillus sp. CC-CFT747]